MPLPKKVTINFAQRWIKEERDQSKLIKIENETENDFCKD